MQHELAEALVEIAEQIGVEARIYENYSGRGMFGRQTTGVVLDDAIHDLPTILFGGAHLIAELKDSCILEDTLDNPFQVDRLGNSSIVY